MLRADDGDGQAIVDRAKHLLKQEVWCVTDAMKLATNEAISEL